MIQTVVYKSSISYCGSDSSVSSTLKKSISLEINPLKPQSSLIIFDGLNDSSSSLLDSSQASSYSLSSNTSSNSEINYDFNIVSRIQFNSSTKHEPNNILSLVVNKKLKRKFKWKNVTQELWNFKVRRNLENDTVSKFYFLNSNDNESDAVENLNFSIKKEQKIKIPKFKKYQTYFLEDDIENILEFNKQPKFVYNIHNNLNMTLRATKSNKRFKFKQLVKSKDILSITNSRNNSNSNTFDILKHIKVSRSCLTKLNKPILINHRIYKKISFIFDAYLSSLERLRYIYSLKKVDERRNLTNEEIKEIKITHKNLKKYNRNHNGSILSLCSSSNKVDAPIVISYSLDHDRLNPELNQTYDQQYIELLIQLQTRDITPEDYELLSRLDEMIKKKTLNDNILNNLKTEVVTNEFLKINSNQLDCGICLESFTEGVVVKHLPCNHIFHLECIDNWLANESTMCPLDKISVDQKINSDSSLNDPLTLYNDLSSFNDDDDHFIIFDVVEKLLVEIESNFIS